MNAAQGKSPVTEKRGFSTRFEDHEKLIHYFAQKCYGRLMEIKKDFGHISYEDVYQELCVSFTKATKTYDPSRGITFTAYFGRAAFNDFNRFAHKFYTECSELGMVSVDSMSDEDDLDVMERFTKGDTLEDWCVRSDEVRQRIASLSPLARLVVKELIAPSEDIVQAHQGMKTHKALAKAQGHTYKQVPQEINLRMIALHYNIAPHMMRRVKQEFEKTLGVNIG